MAEKKLALVGVEKYLLSVRIIHREEEEKGEKGGPAAMAQNRHEAGRNYGCTATSSVAQC
jgi:hypothetical protein